MADSPKMTVPKFSQDVIDYRDAGSAGGVKITADEYKALQDGWRELVDPKVNNWFERTVNSISREFTKYAGGSLHGYLLDCVSKGVDYDTFAAKWGGYASQVDQVTFEM